MITNKKTSVQDGGINWEFELSRILKENKKEELDKLRIYLRSIYKIIETNNGNNKILKLGINDKYCRTYFTYDGNKVVEHDIKHLRTVKTTSGKSKQTPSGRKQKEIDPTSQNFCDLIIHNIVMKMRNMGIVNEEGLFVDLMSGDETINSVNVIKGGQAIDLSIVNDINKQYFMQNKYIVKEFDKLEKEFDTKNSKIIESKSIKKNDTILLLNNIMDMLVEMNISCLLGGIHDSNFDMDDKKNGKTKKKHSSHNKKGKTLKGGVITAIAGAAGAAMVIRSAAVGTDILMTKFKYEAYKQALNTVITALLGENGKVMIRNAGTAIHNGVVYLAVGIGMVANVLYLPINSVILNSGLVNKNKNQTLHIDMPFTFQPVILNNKSDNFTITYKRNSYNIKIYEMMEYIKRLLQFHLKHLFKDENTNIEIVDKLSFNSAKFLFADVIKKNIKHNRLVLRVGYNNLFEIIIKKTDNTDNTHKSSFSINGFDFDIIKIAKILSKLKIKEKGQIENIIDWERIDKSNIIWDRMMFSHVLINSNNLSLINIDQKRERYIIDMNRIYKKLELYLTNFPLYDNMYDMGNINYIDKNSISTIPKDNILMDINDEEYKRLIEEMKQTPQKYGLNLTLSNLNKVEQQIRRAPVKPTRTPVNTAPSQNNVDNQAPLTPNNKKNRVGLQLLVNNDEHSKQAAANRELKESQKQQQVRQNVQQRQASMTQKAIRERGVFQPGFGMGIGYGPQSQFKPFANPKGGAYLFGLIKNKYEKKIAKTVKEIRKANKELESIIKKIENEKGDKSKLIVKQNDVVNKIINLTEELNQLKRKGQKIQHETQLHQQSNNVLYMGQMIPEKQRTKQNKKRRKRTKKRSIPKQTLKQALQYKYIVDENGKEIESEHLKEFNKIHTSDIIINYVTSKNIINPFKTVNNWLKHLKGYEQYRN